MEFTSNIELDKYLKKLNYIGEGSQGVCFIDNNIVIKIFHDYFDNETTTYQKEDILKFSNIKNNTFLWPIEVISLNNKVIGYTTEYKNAKNLYEINPLTINLNALDRALQRVEKDLIIITDNEVCLYDVLYNILYKDNKIYIIDTLDYSYRKVEYQENRYIVDLAIKLFLVDNYFDYFVKNNKLLMDMYLDKCVSGREFLIKFRKCLEEYLEKDINKLSQAKRLVRSNANCKYYRNIV